MADWDINSPADNDIVSQYPGNERAARGAVQTNFGVDHHEVDDADVGKHEQATFVDAIVDPTFAAGEAGVWNNAGKLNTRVAGGVVKRVFSGEVGTQCVFFQAAAPTGWTQDATINDQVLRVVSGAGGGTGGSWVISGVTVDGHALTEAEGPVHNHTGSTGSAGSHAHNIRLGGGGGSSVTLDDATVSFDTLSNISASNAAMDVQGAHTHSVSIGNAGSGQAHSHGLTADGAWRPAYIDVIVASID